MSMADNYRANAAAAARDAAATNLPHVKERCLRSEAAWLTMATRFEEAEVKQAERVSEQQARKARDEDSRALTAAELDDSEDEPLDSDARA